MNKEIKAIKKEEIRVDHLVGLLLKRKQTYLNYLVEQVNTLHDKATELGLTKDYITDKMGFSRTHLENILKGTTLVKAKYGNMEKLVGIIEIYKELIRENK